MIVNELFVEKLWEGSLAVGFIVCGGEKFWIIDDKENFSLNAEKEYRAYLEKNHISQSQFDEACQTFRGGVLNLTAENFYQYLGLRREVVHSKKSLSVILFHDIDGGDELLDCVELSLMSGHKLSGEEYRKTQLIVSRLPLFFINFDRKIFMHLDEGRMHENSVDSDWLAQFGDFVALIPDSERYWQKAGRDYWKCRSI